MLAILMIARMLLGLYQTLVLIAALCQLAGPYPERGISGLVWFGVLCVIQLAIFGLMPLFAKEEA